MANSIEATRAIELFNQQQFTDAFTYFSNLPRSNFSVTMMVKCLYRERNYLDAVCLFNLFPRISVEYISLCAEMQYIRARCFYEAAVQQNEQNLDNQRTYTPPQRILEQLYYGSTVPSTCFELRYTVREFLTNALLIMRTLVELQQSRVTKFTVFLPQLYFALGDYRSAYTECTRLSTRNLSRSAHAENFLMRARIARHFNDNVTAMNDYNSALEHANETTNYALLSLIYSDIVLSTGLTNVTAENGVTNHEFVVSENYVSQNRDAPMMTVNYFTLANHFFTLNTVNPTQLSSYLERHYGSAQSNVQQQYNNWISRQ
jgi:tetratricopeptide (TPR) repeat protein